MGYWNFRVLRKDDRLGIYGVYYNDDGKPHSKDIDRQTPFGKDLEELKTNIELMLECLDKNILDYETLEPIKND